MIDLEDLKAKLTEYDPAAPKCQLQIERHRLVPDPYGDYDETTYVPCCRPEGHEGECRNARQVIGWPGFETMAALVAEVERLRALLHEAYHELHTIDAFTVTPTPPDEFFNLVRRIKEELEQK